MTYGYPPDAPDEPQAAVSQREHDDLQAKVTELEVEINELRRELEEAKKLCGVQLKNIHLHREANKRLLEQNLMVNLDWCKREEEWQRQQ